MSGCTDHYAENEEDALETTKNIISTIGHEVTGWDEEEIDSGMYIERRRAVITAAPYSLL